MPNVFPEDDLVGLGVVREIVGVIVPAVLARVGATVLTDPLGEIVGLLLPPELEVGPSVETAVGASVTVLPDVALVPLVPEELAVGAAVGATVGMEVGVLDDDLPLELAVDGPAVGVLVGVAVR